MTARVRVLIGVVVAAVALYFIIAQPENAAESVRQVASALGSALDSIVRFFRTLFSGT